MMSLLSALTMLSIIPFQIAQSEGKKNEIDRAIEKLTSKNASDLISAVKVIVASKDDAAWNKLRQALINQDVIATLEENKPKVVSFEGMPLDEMYKDLSQFLRVVAEGEASHAIPTLIWLADQKEYIDIENKRIRQHLLFDSFKYIRSPTKELLSFFEGTLTPTSDDGNIKRFVLEALVAFGTQESVKMFEKHKKSHHVRMLAKYRNKYENTKLLIEIYRGASNAKVAHLLLENIFQDEMIHPIGGIFWDPIPLPPISPKGDEAKKFIALFNDFLANPGNIPLAEDEKKKFKDLIKKIEENNREDKEKKK